MTLACFYKFSFGTGNPSPTMKPMVYYINLRFTFCAKKQEGIETLPYMQII